MDDVNLETWKKGVSVHLGHVNSIIEDRKSLKDLLESHLKRFFDYDYIETDREFKVITLTWSHGRTLSIESNIIDMLGMDWKIKTDEANRIVVEVYPFGVED